jgi:hypothetical protein
MRLASAAMRCIYPEDQVRLISWASGGAGHDLCDNATGRRSGQHDAPSPTAGTELLPALNCSRDLITHIDPLPVGAYCALQLRLFFDICG